MKLSSKELKRIARGHLTGHYTITMRAFIVVIFLSLLIDLPFSALLQPTHPSPMQNILYYLVEFLISILAGVLQIGLMSLHLSIARGQSVTLGQMFCCFRTQTDRYILSIICKTLLYGLCIIPGLIGVYRVETASSANALIYSLPLFILTVICFLFVNISFYLTAYLLLDNAELSVWDSFQSSYKFMRGHRGALLYLYLSFLGMSLLELLSFGIGALWIEPYKSQTFAHFYLSVTREPTPSYSTFQTYV